MRGFLRWLFRINTPSRALRRSMRHRGSAAKREDVLLAVGCLLAVADTVLTLLYVLGAPRWVSGIGHLLLWGAFGCATSAFWISARRRTGNVRS